MTRVADRLYNPPRIGHRTPRDVFFYNRREGVTHILQRSPTGVVVTPDIAVFADGACAGNGTFWARAGMGVYFGRGSRRNFNQELTWGRPTSQRAEVQAAIMALVKVKEMIESGAMEARMVVLVLDSAYVVDAMTHHVEFWRRNGWQSIYGEVLRNWRDFQELDSLIEELEYDYGVRVKLWRVDREWNMGADMEAKEAIRGH